MTDKNELKNFLNNWEVAINNAPDQKEAIISFYNRFKRNYGPELLNYYIKDHKIFREYYITGGDVVQIIRGLKEIKINYIEF